MIIEINWEVDCYIKNVSGANYYIFGTILSESVTFVLITGPPTVSVFLFISQHYYYPL